MKKLVATTVLLIFAAISAFAQNSLIGSWLSDPVLEKTDDFNTINITELTFKEDGTFHETSTASMDDLAWPIPNSSDTLHIRFSVTVYVDGNYVIEGSTLKLKYLYKKADGKLNYFEMSCNNPKVQKQIDDSMKTASKMVGGIMTKTLRQSYKEESGIKNNLVIKESTFDFVDDDGLLYHFNKL